MKSRDKNNMLYIIRSGGYRYYKIGITNNINKRFSTLQTGNPVKLVLYRGYIIENRHKLEKLERLIHTKFKEKRIRGEWYMLNKYDLQWLDDLDNLMGLID